MWCWRWVGVKIAMKMYVLDDCSKEKEGEKK
jgi:hypothetical protein